MRLRVVDYVNVVVVVVVVVHHARASRVKIVNHPLARWKWLRDQEHLVVRSCVIDSTRDPRFTPMEAIQPKVTYLSGCIYRRNWPNSFNLTTLGSRVRALSFSFPPGSPSTPVSPSPLSVCFHSSSVCLAVSFWNLSFSRLVPAEVCSRQEKSLLARKIENLPWKPPPWYRRPRVCPRRFTWWSRNADSGWYAWETSLSKNSSLIEWSTNRSI